MQVGDSRERSPSHERTPTSISRVVEVAEAFRGNDVASPTAARREAFAPADLAVNGPSAALTVKAAVSPTSRLERRRAAHTEAARVAELEGVTASQALTIASLQGKIQDLESRFHASELSATRARDDVVRMEGEMRAATSAASAAERSSAAIARDAAADKERLTFEASELEAVLASERAAAAAAASAHGRERAQLEADFDAERRTFQAELASTASHAEANGRRASKAESEAEDLRAAAQRAQSQLAQTQTSLADRESELAASEARRLELERDVRALKEEAGAARATSRAAAEQSAAEAEASQSEMRELCERHAQEVAQAAGLREELAARLETTEAKLAELAEAYEDECGPDIKAETERRVANALGAQREAVNEVAAARAELASRRAAVDSAQAALAHHARTGGAELAAVERALEAAALGSIPGVDAAGEDDIIGALSGALETIPQESALTGELGRAISGVAAAARGCCEALASARRTAAARVTEAEALAQNLRELEEDRSTKARAALDAQRAAIEHEAEGRRARDDAAAAMATADDLAAEIEWQRKALAQESAEARAAVEDAARELLAVQVPANARGATAVAAATRTTVPTDAPWAVLNAFLKEQAQRTAAVVATLVEQLGTAEARVMRAARVAEEERAEHAAIAEKRAASEDALQAAHNEASDLREAMEAQVEAFERAMQQAAGEASKRLETERANAAEARVDVEKSAAAAKEVARRLAGASQALLRWAGPASSALSSLRSQKLFLVREARRAGDRERAAIEALREVVNAASPASGDEGTDAASSDGDAAETDAKPKREAAAETRPRVRGVSRFRACVLAVLGSQRMLRCLSERSQRGGGAQVSTVRGGERVAMLPACAAEALPTDEKLLSLVEAEETKLPGALVELLRTCYGGPWAPGASAFSQWVLPAAPATAAEAGSAVRKANAESELTAAIEAVRYSARVSRQERAELEVALAAALRTADEAADTARTENSKRAQLEDRHVLLESRLAEVEASARAALPAAEAERLMTNVHREREAADASERERAAALAEVDAQLKVMAELRAQATALQVEVHDAHLAQEELKSKLSAARAEASRARDRMGASEHEVEAARREADACRRRARAAEEEAEAARLVLVSAEERTKAAERRAASAEDARARDRESARARGQAVAAEVADAREATRREHEARAKAASAEAAAEALEARTRALEHQLESNAGHAAQLGRALDASRARERLDKAERDATARARSELMSVRRAAERSLAGLATAQLAAGRVGTMRAAHAELARIASPRRAGASVAGAPTSLRQAALEAATATAAAAAASAEAAAAVSPARARTEAAQLASASASRVSMATMQQELSAMQQELGAIGGRGTASRASVPRSPVSVRRNLF